MTLFYDMRTMQILFHPLEDGTFREIRVMSIAETLATIGGEQQKRRLKWKRYYSRHLEKHLARQNHSRATHRDRERTYNYRYERINKMRNGASRGAAGIAGEVAACST